jgi:hypothetical protein
MNSACRVTRLVLLCAAASSAAGCEVIEGVRETRSLRRIAPVEEASLAAVRAGRPAEARQALQTLATLLEREERDWRGRPHGKTIAFDLCLTYGRLGVLAAGTPEEPTFFEQARPWCVLSEQASVRDDTALRTVLRRVDKPMSPSQGDAR